MADPLVQSEIGTGAEPRACQTLDLGRLDYVTAWRMQQTIHERVLSGRWPATLILVEHDPVITVSRRKSAAGHLRAEAAELRALGIDVQLTDRGGDVTYHGPGQLVVYPILSLKPLGFNVGHYMRFLETVIIDTLAAFGVAAQRDPAATGVWVPRETPAGGQTLAKICAMGIRVRKQVTMHGLAVNVSTNLDHFATIVPCGLADRPVTSLAQLMGDRAPTMDAVRATLVRTFQRHYHAATGGSVCDQQGAV